MRIDIHTHLVGISPESGIHLGINPRRSLTYQSLPAGRLKLPLEQGVTVIAGHAGRLHRTQP